MADPLALSELAAALGLLDGGRQHVALVGGGGKTTVAFALGATLPGRVVLTTTTKMGADQDGGLPVLVAPSDDEVAAAAGRSPVVAWSRVTGSKAVGVDPERCDRWFGLVDHVVVEADGARGRPFKAPAELEPVVPATTTLVVSVIGADALGRVIADQCHRPLRVAALAGCSPSELLTPTRAATVLLHPRGALRARPRGARSAVVVNQVDDRSRPLADALLAELATHDPSVAALTVAHDPARPPGSVRQISR